MNTLLYILLVVFLIIPFSLMIPGLIFLGDLPMIDLGNYNVYELLAIPIILTIGLSFGLYKIMK